MAWTLTQDKLALWRADPVAFAEAQVMRRPDGTLGPPVLSERQKGWLRALAEREDGRPKYRTVGIVTPKRAGKTLVSALALVWKSLGQDRRSVCLANSRESAQSLGFDLVKELLERGPLQGEAQIQRGRLAIPSLNTEILAVPCSGRSVAGITIRGGLLVSDELWAADDPEPWRLLSSQTEGAEAQVLLVSQPSGMDSDVFRLWEASQEGAPGLWFDYVGPAVVAAEGHPNPYVTPEFLAERRAALPEALFNQYFLGEWGSADNGFLPPEVVARCDTDYEFPADLAGWKAFVEEYAGGREVEVVVAGGLDRALPFARRDESVMCWVAKVPGQGAEALPVFYVVGLFTSKTGHETELLGAAARMDEVFDRRVPWIAETYQCADLAAKLRADLRAATGPAQVEMFSLLSRLAQEGRLKWPKGPQGDKLREQVARFRVDTSGPTPKFSGGSKAAVDDAMYALGWAVLGAQERTYRRPRIYFASEGSEDGEDVPPVNPWRISYGPSGDGTTT